MIKNELINLIKLLEKDKKNPYTLEDIEKAKQTAKPGNTATKKLEEFRIKPC